MAKNKSVFPLKSKGRSTQMAEFMATFTARDQSGLVGSIELLGYCEKFFLGVPVRTLIKLASERELNVKARSGRCADGRYFWRVVLRKGACRFLCFFNCPKDLQPWCDDFSAIIQDYRVLGLKCVEMKRVTRCQRERELAKLNPAHGPFIDLPKK